MKKILALVLALTMTLALAVCGGDAPETTAPVASAIPGVEDGVLTVGMECAYAPYNWTQMDDSNGAVPIAKKICDAYGWTLEPTVFPPPSSVPPPTSTGPRWSPSSTEPTTNPISAPGTGRGHYISIQTFYHSSKDFVEFPHISSMHFQFA